MTTEPREETTSFIVSYEGDALAENTMPVRDLAPALLALGEAYERANAILNRDRARVSLQIRATQQGSFEIALILQQVYNEAATLLSGDFITSATNLKELLFGGASVVGLITLLKRLRGGQPEEADTGPDGNSVLEIQGLRLTVPSDVMRLFADRVMRDSAEAIVEPVTKEGVDRVVFRDETQTLETVNKDEAAFFHPAELQTDGLTTTWVRLSNVILQPTVVRFAKGGKWRLSDGNRTDYYTIKDTLFLGEVEQGRRTFGGKDSLICDVEIEQTIDSNGNLVTDYSIIAVAEHIRHISDQAEMELPGDD